MNNQLTDNDVWKILYNKRISSLQETACKQYLNGLNVLKIYEDLPTVDNVNETLYPITGWKIYPVSGFLPADEFFSLLSQRLFPAVTSVRPASEIDYTEAPDIFHDVFGHTPLHADKDFADFLQKIGELGVKYSSNPKLLKYITSYFWFSIEFGLIKENNNIKIYGSGLISSHGDAENALSDNCTRLTFNFKDVILQEYRIDNIQPILFVVESFEHLLLETLQFEKFLEEEYAQSRN
jgi:phenylalanine-4-hydroxylase